MSDIASISGTGSWGPTTRLQSEALVGTAKTARAAASLTEQEVASSLTAARAEVTNDFGQRVGTTLHVIAWEGAPALSSP